MPYLKNKDGTDIYYECHGKGEPLVFIHGLGASSSMYKPQVAYFKDFFKVVLVDLRGNGKSGILNCLPEKALDKQIGDIAVLLKELKLESSIFVGVSYGGVLIQKLAITYPEIIKALIITDSFCDTTINSFQKLLAMIGANQIWVLDMPKKWLAKLTKVSYNKWNLASEQMEKVILNMRKNETKVQRKAINKIKFNEHLSTLKIPALCLVGSQTKLGVQMMQQVSEFIPNSEMYVIENAFDPSNLCQPQTFNEIVHKFISKL